MGTFCKVNNNPISRNINAFVQHLNLDIDDKVSFFLSQTVICTCLLLIPDPVLSDLYLTPLLGCRVLAVSEEISRLWA